MASDCALDLFHLYSLPELLNIGATELPHSSCELLESAAIQAAAERLVRYSENGVSRESGNGTIILWTSLDSCGYLQEATEVLCSLADNNSFLSQIIPEKEFTYSCPLEGVGKRVPCLFVYVSLHVDVCCMHACMSFSVCVCVVFKCVFASVCVCACLRACMHMRTYVCI